MTEIRDQVSEVGGPDCRHDRRTPPFAFTRRLVVFCCLYAVGVTVAAFRDPAAAVQIIPVLQGVAGLLGACLLVYGVRSGLTDNAGTLAKLIRGGPS